MSRKLPFIQLWAANYSADTRRLKPATRGIWVDVFLYLHTKTDSRGTGAGDEAFWCRVAGCSVPELWSAISDLAENDDAGEGEPPRVEWSNAGEIRFTSRRILREETKRTSANARLKAYRERKAAAVADALKRSRNALETPAETPAETPPQRPIFSDAHNSEVQRTTSKNEQPAGGCPERPLPRGTENDDGGKSRPLDRGDVPLYPVFQLTAKAAKLGIGDVARELVDGSAPAVTLGWLLMVASDVRSGACRNPGALFRTVAKKPSPPDEFYAEAKRMLRDYGVGEEVPAEVKAALTHWLGSHAVTS